MVYPLSSLPHSQKKTGHFSYHRTLSQRCHFLRGLIREFNQPCLGNARQPEVDFFTLLSRDFEQIFRQIVSIRIKTLGDTNTVASRHIKREKGSLPVDVRDTQQYKFDSGKAYFKG